MHITDHRETEKKRKRDTEKQREKKRRRETEREKEKQSNKDQVGIQNLAKM